MAPLAEFKIYNVKQTIASLRKQSLKGRTSLKLQVGYSAHYSVHVHENLAAYHPNGQAKFLETPARVLRGEIEKIIQARLRRKKSLEEALLAAGNFLLAASQQIVPVDTGFLRASGFVRIEK